ncbi:SCP2 sterol-binding domain-containing protein [Micromonospora sp. NPDC049102]|uniref:SCP2 sterol-binding domain-containing protein n=1 Tax=Micromonospora sp. NPDC049102 TaxID=3364265 RepID=UPI00371C59F5
MATTASSYLEQLDTSRSFDLPETTTGTLRLDLRDDGHTEHWYLTVAGQHLAVTRSAEDADLIVRAARSVFDELVNGDLPPGTAMLRNELTLRGDMRLLLVLRRVLPGPKGARHPRELGRAALARRHASAGRAASGGRDDRP